MKHLRDNNYLASMSLMIRCVFAGMLGYIAAPDETTAGKEKIRL